jgi:hypothetical protein
MRKIIAALVTGACLIALSGAFGAEKAPRAPEKTPVAPLATIVAIKGNVVTIADMRGRKKDLEVESVQGLKPGAQVSWCEDDCRVLRSNDKSVPIKRVVEPGQ